MTNTYIKKLIQITPLLLSFFFSPITTNAERLMTLPNQQTNYNQNQIQETTFKKVETQSINEYFTIQFVKIDLTEHYGSGTIIPSGYLSKNGPLSGEGLLSTTHIFQEKRIKEYLEQNGAINISGDQTLKCKYSFGETLEYAVFVPIQLIRNMQNAGWMELTNLYTLQTSSEFQEANINPYNSTNIVGSKSGYINLFDRQVQSGDSGSLIYQNFQSYFNTLGVQFGFSKNTIKPYTVFWKLYKDNDQVKAKVNWLNNKQNILEWQDGDFIPKNCSKAFPIQQSTSGFRLERL